MKKLAFFFLSAVILQLFAVEILPNMNYNYKIQMAADVHNHGFLD